MPCFQGNKNNVFHAELQSGYLVNPATNLKLFAYLSFRNFKPDAVTDQTSAHDPLNGYLPAGWTLEQADIARANDPDSLVAAAKESMVFHRDQWNEMSDAAIEQAKSELGVKFVEVEKGPFIEAVLPMHDEAAAKSPVVADLIDRIKAKAN